jgi:quinoprotein glucose dehydrogenase
MLAPDPAADKKLVAPVGEHYYSGFGFMIASDGLSPIAPPWTSLTAYDLNEGTIKWKIPLGEVAELAAKGIKNTGAHFPKVGPVVTAGGKLEGILSMDDLVVHSAARLGDRMIELSYDDIVETLKRVYRADLPEIVRERVAAA